MTRQQRQFYAMGCHMTVWLDSAANVLEDVEKQFGRTETRFSRFIPIVSLTKSMPRAVIGQLYRPNFSALLKERCSFRPKQLPTYPQTPLHNLPYANTASTPRRCHSASPEEVAETEKQYIPVGKLLIIGLGDESQKSHFCKELSASLQDSRPKA